MTLMKEELIPTRRSLLSRLKRWDDQQSWREFLDLYGPLIRRVGLKAGLSDPEAEDVIQDTLLIVAKKMPDFHYDPARGSFKSWLLLIVRRRIEKQLKKRIPYSGASGARNSGAEGRSESVPEDTRRTATVERVPDPAGFDLEAVWDAEWEKNLWSGALARVKARVTPKQFQMFDLYVTKEWPVKEVARALNVSMAHVYVNKHRLARMLRDEVERLQAAS